MPAPTPPCSPSSNSAYQRKAPILLWIYSPHWAPAKYEGEWVEFPEYTPDCYTDPAWGMNPDMAYDCGKPHRRDLEICLGRHEGQVAGRLQGRQELPARRGRDERADLARSISTARALEEVAAAWVAANQDKIKKWAGQ